MDLRVAFEDEHLLVVDKPAGIVVHPGTGHREGGTLVHGLLALDAAGGDDEDRPGIVHRLDRDTSGLLVVARSDEAHARLEELIRRRELERRYLALVKGRPRSRTGRIEAPIGRDRQDRTRHSLDTATPRRARDALRARRGARRAHAARGHARDRPYASDPRPPGSDRPARSRAIPSTASQETWASSASSSTRRASRSSIRSRASGSRRSRRSRTTSPLRSSAPRAWNQPSL